MDINSDLTALAAAQAGLWEDCAARMNEITPSTPITTLRGSGWLMTNFPDDAESILAGFADAQVASAVDGSPLNQYFHRIKRINSLLDTSGIDWSSENLQALLPVVAQVARWDDTLLEKVKAIGLRKPTITADDCKNIWAQQNKAAFDVLWNEHASPVVHDWAALKAAIADILEAM